MNWLQIVLSLIGVFGLLFMLLYALRKLNAKNAISGGSRMKVIDRMTIGKDSMLLVVSVCGKLSVIGVSPQKIEKLYDLDITAEEYGVGAASSTQRLGESFGTVLAGVFKKNKETKGEDATVCDEDVEKSSNKSDSAEKGNPQQ